MNINEVQGAYIMTTYITFECSGARADESRINHVCWKAWKSARAFIWVLINACSEVDYFTINDNAYF